MRNHLQRHAILLAALLQVLPIIRNFFANPAAANAYAFILKWGIGSAVVVGGYDACSGATNYFTSPTNFTGNVGVFFTNNLTLFVSGKDGGAIGTITSNLVSAAIIANQTTNFAMPPGLNIRLIDNTALTNPVYLAIFGTPTALKTNSFRVTLAYQTLTVSTNITITILPGGIAPTITNQPNGITNVAGGNATFTIVAGANPAPAYQWRQGASTLAGATNASLSFTNLRAAQAGSYTVVITNSAGAITSSPALLGVTNPLPPRINSTVFAGSQLQFTFNPILGLTNTVLTNSTLIGGTWNVFTNLPPPTNTNPFTIQTPVDSPRLFFRLQVIP